MTVQELIELLRYEDPKSEVHVVYQSGDHWRTLLAPKVRSVEEARVESSKYHGTDTLLEDDDMDGETYDKARQVVTLRI